MAKIVLSNLRHSYAEDPIKDSDYVLEQVDLDWQDGGAYALLGPSGCGKSTLLNIISGLLTPTHGRVLFDDQDVTNQSSDERNIAQVFQFPVIYDTMSVYDNLAFPLRNRGVESQVIERRVQDIAGMLEIEHMLEKKAAGLSPDNKQKLSMGRGLVRDNVNVVMFDEPLTVVDPHLKWKLRSKLKELHQKTNLTMIYVTHDQTEALTFADQVVVMDAGKIVQIGTPLELFERPEHTFVGHFIGSPGMNLLPCSIMNDDVVFNGQPVELESLLSEDQKNLSGELEIGIRPEFVHFSDTGIAATVTKISDVGRHWIIETIVEAAVQASYGPVSITLLSEKIIPALGEKVHLMLEPKYTRLYCDGWLVSRAEKQ